MKTVLILGAHGRFGQAAAQAFANSGWRVLAQVRRESNGNWPEGTEVLRQPLADTQGLIRAASGARVVVYAVNPAYADWENRALPLLRQGLAVASALQARFMLPGNVYNFGSQLPAELREDTPQQADHVKARIRVAMESEMQQAAQEAQRQGRGLRCVVIRAGDFFGSGRGSWFDLSIVKGIARGRLTYPGPLNLPHAWAYLPDFAQAFERLACAPLHTEFETLHFRGYAITGQELLNGIEAAATELGLRPPQGFRIGGLPWGLIRAVGRVYRPWRELASMSYLWSRPHVLDGRALASRVALPPATPMVQALRHSLIDLGLATAKAAAPARATTSA
jgi:nucleoside-diphosphate-sugar epimerase